MVLVYLSLHKNILPFVLKSIICSIVSLEVEITDVMERGGRLRVIRVKRRVHDTKMCGIDIKAWRIRVDGLRKWQNNANLRVGGKCTCCCWSCVGFVVLLLFGRVIIDTFHILPKKNISNLDIATSSRWSSSNNLIENLSMPNQKYWWNAMLLLCHENKVITCTCT